MYDLYDYENVTLLQFGVPKKMSKYKIGRDQKNILIDLLRLFLIDLRKIRIKIGVDGRTLYCALNDHCPIKPIVITSIVILGLFLFTRYLDFGRSENILVLRRYGFTFVCEHTSSYKSVRMNT